MSVKVKITGLRQIQRNLKRLKDQEGKKILKAGLRAGAKAMRDRVRAQAPRVTGRLWRNIVVRSKTFRDRNFTAFVFIREEGKAGSERNAFYWRFVEFGTRGGTGNPFIRRAWEAFRRAAVNRAIKEMRDRYRRVRFKGVKRGRR